MKHKEPVLREHSPFAKSRWIWPDELNWDLHNGYALFRKSFEVARVPRRAPFFITADQAYRLYLNGQYVGRGPARGFQESWPYDEIDVARHLRPGRNVLAVRAYNPGYSTFQYLSQGFAGLLVAARWGKTSVVSDESWKTLRQPGINRAASPSSMQLFPQEHVDLRETPVDWTAPDFDDGAWRSPAFRPWNSAPWYELEPRNIPLLAEKELPAPVLIGTGEGRCAEGYAQVRDVVALRQQEERNHQPIAATAEPVCVSATDVGRFRSYLFDFGQTVFGSLIFEVEGASGGEIVDTHLAETVAAGTLTPDQVIPTHCRMAFGDRFIARPGSYVYRFFHHYGFRYLMVTVRDATSDFRLGVKLNWIGYPLEKKGAFTSSDPLLEKIWETCAWTQQCCSLDAYVDILGGNRPNGGATPESRAGILFISAATPAFFDAALPRLRARQHRTGSPTATRPPWRTSVSCPTLP
jgi:alpha-L-rhamnosidase